MNVIIDNMVVRRVLLVEGDVDFSLVRKKLLDKALKLAYGGKLLDEYCMSQAVRAVVKRLDQAGSARAYDDDKIEARKALIKRSGLCRSNDIHIIALAQESGARLLCSQDQSLHQDFRNSRLIRDPRGKVYQCRSHAQMLERYCDDCRRRLRRG